MAHKDINNMCEIPSLRKPLFYFSIFFAHCKNQLSHHYILSEKMPMKYQNHIFMKKNLYTIFALFLLFLIAFISQIFIVYTAQIKVNCPKIQYLENIFRIETLMYSIYIFSFLSLSICSKLMATCNLCMFPKFSKY